MCRESRDDPYGSSIHGFSVLFSYLILSYLIRSPKPLLPCTEAAFAVGWGTTEWSVVATAALLTGQQSNNGFACEGSFIQAAGATNREAATERGGILDDRKYDSRDTPRTRVFFLLRLTCI